MNHADLTAAGSDRTQQDRGWPSLHLCRRLAAVHRLGLRLRAALALHPVRHVDLDHGQLLPACYRAAGTDRHRDPGHGVAFSARPWGYADG
jgi:hypothetical protein